MAVKPGGRVITLVKPQYEAGRETLVGGVVAAEQLSAVLAACRADIVAGGWGVMAEIESPLRGHGGNVEFLWLLAPTDQDVGSEASG